MNDDAQAAALALLSLTPALLKPPQSQTPSTAQAVPQKRSSDAVSEAIDCICGVTQDDGFSIACDDCGKWCHAVCFGIVSHDVPEKWSCWVCLPRTVGAVAAEPPTTSTAKTQGGKLSVGEEKSAGGRRRLSPGIEKDKKRSRTSTVDGANKRKRRASLNVNTTNLHPHHQQPSSHPPLSSAAEDEHVDVDEPWVQQYVPILHDKVDLPVVRGKLRAWAQRWRGLTVFTVLQPLSPCISTKPLPAPASGYLPRTTVQILAPPHLPNTNADILPPSYALHTTQPVPSHTLLKEYVSEIIPSASYLADPLNAYAGLGMPKPFVHLFGAPLDVALDARVVGGEGRFARSGCRPNAVLRPVICPPKNESGVGEGEETTLTFGIFAIRDLKANEEIILGWEWDDNHSIHQLPHIISSPHMFSPTHLQQVRGQMTHILHALSSTFTKCACGAHAQDCAVSMMERFADGDFPEPDAGLDGAKTVYLGPLVGVKRGFRTKEKVPFSGGFGGIVMDSGVDEREEQEESDPGLVAGPSGSHSHDNGEEHEAPGRIQDIPVVTLSSPTPSPQKRDPKEKQKQKGKGKGKGKECAVECLRDMGTNGSVIRRSRKDKNTRQSPKHSPQQPHVKPETPLTRYQSHKIFPSVPPSMTDCDEEKMPPKFRKRWMHEALKQLLAEREKEGVGGESDPSCPDIPMPASDCGHPESLEHNQSPSVSFARLSLFSPLAPPPPATPFWSADDGSRTPGAPAPTEEMPQPEPSTKSLTDDMPSPDPGQPRPDDAPPSASPPPQKSPTPPPLPKVKMSLKDFALRKKKQREEMAVTRHVEEESAFTFEGAMSPGSGGKSLLGYDKGPGEAEDTGGRSHDERDGNAMDIDNGLQDYLVKTEVGEGMGIEVGASAVAMRGGGTRPTNGAPMTPDPTPVLPSSSMFASPTFNQAGSLPRPSNTRMDAVASYGPAESADSIASTPSPPHPNLNGAAYLDTRKFQAEPYAASLPTPPLGSNPKFSGFQALQEDGEIINVTPPKGRQPPNATARWFSPRSHTPPTQPRSFHATSASASTLPGPLSPARRASQPIGYPNVAAVSTAVARPLPSGPRALRAPANTTVYPLLPPRSSSTPGPPFFLPRGPSADRSEWDREGSRDWYPRARGRGAWGGR